METTLMERHMILGKMLPSRVSRCLSESLEGANVPEAFYQTLIDAFSGKNICQGGAYAEEIAKTMDQLGLVELRQRFDENMAKPRDTFISCRDTILEYIDQSDWRIHANANVNYNSVGLTNQTAGKVIANHWLNEVYSEDVGEAHRRGDFHIHDLDCLTGYCAGWSLRKLLNEGFRGMDGYVSSAAPRTLQDALNQCVTFLVTLQTEWAGAQAFSSFDSYLAPFIFLENLSFSEVKTAIRHFVYNLNVPTRGGQSPFTNITLDFTCPKDLCDQIPSCENRHLFEAADGEDFLARVQQRGFKDPTEMTFKDFQAEMEMIDVAYYEVMTEGDSRGKAFTFPIPTVNITESFRWDSPASEALFKNTAKMGNSYFQNFIGSQWITDDAGRKVPNPEAYKPDAVRSMCCRLQLDLRELLKRGNGLFGSAELTGSVGVVTLNMARLGHRFKGDEAGMLREIQRLMDLACESLEKKRQFVQEMYNRGLYPHTKHYLPGFKNHFSTVGVNGMNEMLMNFSDNTIDVSSPEGVEFCSRILEFMRDRLKVYQRETGNLYNLEATPAEGTTYRFAKEDKKYYPGMIQAGEGDEVYYTNSSQLPVGFTDDPYKALELQEKLQCKYTGGTVLHLYMREKISSAEACKRFIRSVITNYRLPYVTVTPVFSTCESHGYLTGEQKLCPTCGRETLIWSRVMGYYRPVSGYNRGKKQEHKDRTFFAEPVLVSEGYMGQYTEECIDPYSCTKPVAAGQN